MRLHAFGGRGVLPTTFAMARMMMSSDLKLTYPFSLDDYVLYKGVTFSSQAEQKVLLIDGLLNLTAKEETVQSPQQVKLFSQLESGKKTFHYGALVNSAPQVLRHRYDVLNLQVTHGLSKKEIYDKALFHEGVLQGITKVISCDAQSIVVQCHCSSEEAKIFLGEFSAGVSHPILDDLILQTLILWPRLNHDVSALPSQFKRWLYLQPIPLDADFYISLQVRNSNAFKLLADIVVHDEQGSIFSEVNGAEATLSGKLNTLFTQRIS